MREGKAIPYKIGDQIRILNYRPMAASRRHGLLEPYTFKPTRHHWQRRKHYLFKNVCHNCQKLVDKDIRCTLLKVFSSSRSGEALDTGLHKRDSVIKGMFQSSFWGLKRSREVLSFGIATQRDAMLDGNQEPRTERLAWISTRSIFDIDNGLSDHQPPNLGKDP